MACRHPARWSWRTLDGKVREVFQAGEAALPAELAGGISASLMPEGGRVRTVLTRFEDRPYLLVSDAVENTGGVVMGSLLVVVPVDAAFLAASQRGVAPGQVLVALVDPEEQRILASMEPEVLFPGTLIAQWQDRYLITTQSLPAYEGWDWYPLLATFIPHDSVKRMTQRVRDLERRQRTIAALVFILVFTSIIYLVSSRLNHVLKRMSRFSQRALGIAEPNFQRAGNQLLLLEDWIKHFTQLVLRAREELSRQHETEMRRSEALKAAMMEASLDSIVTLNRRGEVIELNPTAEHALGYTRDQTMGSLFVETCVAAADRDLFDQLLEESRRARREGGEPPARRELTALRRDGTQVPVELSIVPINLDRNLFYTLYIHDITKRRLAELEIQSLARFAGESPNPILRVTSDAVITYANPASQGLLAALDRSQGQALPAEWAGLVTAALAEGRAREQEWDLGGRIYAILFAPIPESAYVNLYARDITAVRRAEQEARQHQAELVHVCRLSTMGEVATGMAHELNQPLAAIANYASGASRRLQGGTDDPAPLVEAMGQITSQARRAGEIIRRLRALVGKQAPSRGAADLNHLVREVCSFVEFETGRLEVQHRPGSGPRGDPGGGGPGADRAGPAQSGDQCPGRPGGGPGGGAPPPHPHPSGGEGGRGGGRGHRARHHPEGWNGSSSPSTPPRTRAWGWACPSVRPSSRTTAGASGPTRPRGTGPVSMWSCPSRRGGRVPTGTEGRAGR